MINTLVVYYSLEGNCEFISQVISQELDCDLMKIVPEKEIDSGKSSKYFFGGKQAMMKECPKLNPLSKNLAEYDLIIIGTPVWAWTFSPPIRSLITQMNSTKISGKHVAFFCCHEGGKGKTLEKLESSLSGNSCVGKIDFYAPMKKDKERCRTIAQAWANEVYNKVKLNEKEERVN